MSPGQKRAPSEFWFQWDGASDNKVPISRQPSRRAGWMLQTAFPLSMVE